MNFNRMTPPALQFGSKLSRTLLSLSVRARIIILAVTPLLGFALIGLSFISGEREIERAFETMKTASSIADASRDLKNGLISLKTSAQEFSLSSGKKRINDADEIYVQSLIRLKLIEQSKQIDEKKISVLNSRLNDLKERFAEIEKAQEKLGTDESGLERRLQTASAALERTFNRGIDWLSESDRKQLLVSALRMLHFDSKFRLTRQDLSNILFFQEFETFKNSLGIMNLNPARSRLASIRKSS